MNIRILAIAILAAASLGLAPPARAQSSMSEKCDKTPPAQLTLDEMRICVSYYTAMAHVARMNMLLREDEAVRNTRNIQKPAGQ
jgi:hypothetical protein